jgi:hypothetical protein
MQNLPKFHPTYGKLHHVGLVVKDMDKAIAYFESMGLGPFKGRGDTKWGIVPFKGELHSKTAEWKTKISNAQLGDVQLELLEPIEGPQALKEFWTRQVKVYTISALSPMMWMPKCGRAPLGWKVWTSSKKPDGTTAFCYFEPTEVGRASHRNQVQVSRQTVHKPPKRIVRQEGQLVGLRDSRESRNKISIQSNVGCQSLHLHTTSRETLLRHIHYRYISLP